ncbi:Cytochrome c oxidase subunit 6 [Glutinoglossum americanum]|uniref:Cytochrome c oxidase subunit 6, mitochondrial n=1 Tax=Glutinoglossum americanum TaxID=1670608 RepID=A0A9P8L738_9PEZI|nr:Cytochrome c oxidase subunit 6 [Glutinoglossum americanum]
MSSLPLLRFAARSSGSAFLRSSYTVRRMPVVSSASSSAVVVPTFGVAYGSNFSTSVRKQSDDAHAEESFEEFSARYEKEFENVQDVFELQVRIAYLDRLANPLRNLNNAFAYDLVPSPSVITAALKAARRVNDFPTAVRIFEGIKAKVENKGQYEEYLTELKDLREELGISLKEDLYPGEQ